MDKKRFLTRLLRPSTGREFLRFHNQDAAMSVVADAVGRVPQEAAAKLRVVAVPDHNQLKKPQPAESDCCSTAGSCSWKAYAIFKAPEVMPGMNG
jgi:hypothetical protein